MKRTRPATNKERALRTRDARCGGAYVVDGRDNAWRSRAPGPHAHGDAARQALDGLRTEVWGQQKQSNDPRNNQHNPQYANYWAPLTRKRHIPPHPAQPRHTNYWAPRTWKRHQQEHRPQRPTERSDPTQHAKGRTPPKPAPPPSKANQRHGFGAFGAKRIYDSNFLARLRRGTIRGPWEEGGVPAQTPIPPYTPPSNTSLPQPGPLHPIPQGGRTRAHALGPSHLSPSGAGRRGKGAGGGGVGPAPATHRPSPVCPVDPDVPGAVVGPTRACGCSGVCLRGRTRRRSGNRRWRRCDGVVGERGSDGAVGGLKGDVGPSFEGPGEVNGKRLNGPGHESRWRWKGRCCERWVGVCPSPALTPDECPPPPSPEGSIGMAVHRRRRRGYPLHPPPPPHPQTKGTPLPMFEADSQNFASAPSSRGLLFKNFRRAFGGDPGRRGGPSQTPHPPIPPPLRDHRGKTRNLTLGQSDRAILGTRTHFWSPDPPPPLLQSIPCPPPPPPLKRSGPQRFRMSKGEGANRRRQRQTIRYRGLVPTCPPPSNQIHPLPAPPPPPPPRHSPGYGCSAQPSQGRWCRGWSAPGPDPPGTQQLQRHAVDAPGEPAPPRALRWSRGARHRGRGPALRTEADADPSDVLVPRPAADGETEPAGQRSGVVWISVRGETSIRRQHHSRPPPP